MDSPCRKQTVCKVLKIFQYGKHLVAYVLKRIAVWQKQVYRKTQVQVNQNMESHSVESEFRITEMQSLLYFYRNNQMELSPRPFSWNVKCILRRGTLC